MSSPSSSLSSSATQSTTSAESKNGPTIYPPVTHSLSPTHFHWVKLTSYEIHHVLTPAPPQFADYSYNANRDEQRPPALYHYINHPIQYVYVSGIVVEINEYNIKYYLFILDDSSGATIEVVYPRPAGVMPDMNAGANVAGANTSDQAPSNGISASSKPGTEVDPEEVQIHNLLSQLEIGTVLKVKGHITTFRSNRQIRLDRINHVTTINEEAAFWTSMQQFHATILSSPWTLSPSDIAQAKAEAQTRTTQNLAREARRRERAALRGQMEEKGRLKLEKRWEKEEKKRADEAEKVRVEGEELMKTTKRKRESKGSSAENEAAHPVKADEPFLEGDPLAGYMPPPTSRRRRNRDTEF